MEHVEQFDSLGAMLAHIETSKGKREFKTLAHNQSITNTARFAGIGLADAVQGAKTLSWDGLAARIEQIDTIANTLTGNVPAGVSVRRQPAWKAQGARVNIHRVLNGNLAHAWRSTIRVPHAMPGMGRLVLLVPAMVAANVGHAEREWAAIATLALADYARRQGRAVEIWSVGWHSDAFLSGANYIWLAPIQKAGDSWHSETVALVTYPEWSRRFGFRLLEQASAIHGEISEGYGRAATEQQLLAWARDTWAPSQGIPAACVWLGATQYALVNDQASAQRWLRAQLDSSAAA